MVKIDRFINKWKGNIEDAGSVTSESYKKFEKEYEKLLIEISKNIGFKLHQFNKGHYYFSAVFECEGKYYYIIIDDVRYSNSWIDYILYRTMRHSEDWHGGSNYFCSLNELQSRLKGLHNYEKRK